MVTGATTTTHLTPLAFPEITVHPITDDVEFMVIACDGIWDCMSNEDVVLFIRSRIAEGKALSVITEEIVQSCLSTDSYMGAVGCDNMTILIIGFLRGASMQDWQEKCRKPLESVDIK